MQQIEEFRETELGLLPKDWTVVKLEQVTENLDNKRIPLNEEERRKKQGLYPYCGANGIIDYVNNYIYDGEFILLAEDGGYWGVGEKSSYIMNGKFWVNNHAHVIKAIESKTTNKFLCYALNHIDMSPLIGGDARGKLTQAIMRSIPLPLPPLPEQQNIAFVLSTVQDAQQSTERAINSLRELKKSLMKHLFTYGAVSFEDADKVKLKETEIGKVPEGWNVLPLSDVADNFIGGGTPSTAKKEYWNGSIQWTTSKKITDRILTDGEKTITKLGLENSATHLIPKENLIIGTRVGVGKVAINKIDVAISQDLTGVFINKNKYSVEFLAYQLGTESCQKRFSVCARGTTIKGIPRDDLIKMPMKIPSLPEQQQIVSILATVDEKIDAEEQRRKALDVLFNSLLKNLMTAEIRVNELEVM